jgi:branched-chain amino acid aminotransferase
MAMPELPEKLFLEAVERLVALERAWIPEGEGSLYLRPFMFSSEAFLGVRPSNEYIFCVIACPAGNYFKGGAKPLSLWVSEDISRAAPGGTGDAKCGGNYAASLIAQAEASRNGCDQVVFLDAVEHRWVEELGGMNLFFVMDDNRIVTPQLGGTILPGITRKSLITLARDCGLAVEERRYSMAEWRSDAQCGRLIEAFACGTAAVIAGIGEVRSSSYAFTIGTGETGALTRALCDELVGMQRGTIADRHGWLRPI